MGIIKLNDIEYCGSNIDITTTLDENSTDMQAASAKAVYEKLKKVNADTVDGWHIYSSLAELGLSGSVTMNDVITTMPNKSEFRFTNNTENPNCVSDVPDKYGFLIIKKNLYAEATWIAVNRKTAVPMYFGSWHSDNGWTGWSNSDSSHLSNHNYLDNSDFKINQRGLTTYSSATDAIYCMDRWLINPNMTIAYSDTGSVLVTQSADQKQHFRQYLSDPKRFAGKTVTLSIGTTATEGDIRLAIYDSPSTMTEGTWKYADKNVFTVNIESGIRAVSIIPTTLGSTIEIQWVKLEIGSAATIYSPPDYAEELLKIQTMTDDGYTRLITNDTMPIIINSQMITNPNLLDNPDFSINQRGLTEYDVASKTYTVDRWKTPNVPSLIIPGNKQITIQRHSTATSKFSGLGQVVEKLVKGVYTFSVDIVSADATIPTITIRAVDWTDIANNASGAYYGIKSITNSADIVGRHSITFELPEDKENVYLYVYASNMETEDAKFTIANAKLEAGKIATPFVAPHPAEELVKCQRYYQIMPSFYTLCACNETALYFTNNLPTTLRSTPSIDGDILWRLSKISTNTITAESATSTDWEVRINTINSKSEVMLLLVKSGHGITGDHYLYISSGGLSADL